jgi:hypothetical protein
MRSDIVRAVIKKCRPDISKPELKTAWEHGRKDGLVGHKNPRELWRAASVAEEVHRLRGSYRLVGANR